ncbi:unnamed protein product [Rotaria sp. Silwood2]|nr:unnamed protein product [Rotaria sp. Silwood2]
MSSSNTTVNMIASLNSASNFLNCHFPIFIFIFGIMGNLLNVFVLNQPTLRLNISALFFNFSSIAELLAIFSGLIAQMLSGYVADLSATIGWICKVRSIVLYCSRTIVLWLIVLASVDRWLTSSTSVRLRRMSTMKNARRSMFVVLVYTCILNAPTLYCFEANNLSPPRPCYASTYMCRVITDLLYAFGTTLFPLLLMIIFGFMTIKNVHHARIRIQMTTNLEQNLKNTIASTTINRQLQARKLDRHLIKMLLVQVFLLFLLTCPHAIFRLHLTFTSNPPQKSLQYAIQILIYNLFILLTYVANGMPFYIYTLCGGAVFRNTLLNLLKTILNKISHP